MQFVVEHPDCSGRGSSIEDTEFFIVEAETKEQAVEKVARLIWIRRGYDDPKEEFPFETYLKRATTTDIDMIIGHEADIVE